MRVENPNHGPHDHGFGQGAAQPEHHDISLGGEQLDPQHTTEPTHGIFEHFDTNPDVHGGGHVEIGHLDHDFGHDGLHDGLDGLHDSVHHGGLGFEVDHAVHDGLHHDVHDPQHDVQHHDGIGDIFHHG